MSEGEQGSRHGFDDLEERQDGRAQKETQRPADIAQQWNSRVSQHFLDIIES